MRSLRKVPEPRTATFADAAAISALVTQLGYPSTEDDVQRRLARVLADARHVVFVSVDDDGRVVGCLHAHVQWLIDYETFVEIDSLVVDESVRGSGHGRRLMYRAEEWAGENGIEIVRVRSRVEREKTHAFYEKLGYERRKTQHVFQRTLSNDGAR